MWHKAFESDEVNNIIQALGIRFGVDGEDSKEANIDKLRYKKVIIMTDADVDGSHIDTLIMTLFFRYFPQVIQHGFLHIQNLTAEREDGLESTVTSLFGRTAGGVTLDEE